MLVANRAPSNRRGRNDSASACCARRKLSPFLCFLLTVTHRYLCAPIRKLVSWASLFCVWSIGNFLPLLRWPCLWCHTHTERASDRVLCQRLHKEILTCGRIVERPRPVSDEMVDFVTDSKVKKNSGKLFSVVRWFGKDVSALSLFFQAHVNVAWLNGAIAAVRTGSPKKSVPIPDVVDGDSFLRLRIHSVAKDWSSFLNWRLFFGWAWFAFWCCSSWGIRNVQNCSLLLWKGENLCVCTAFGKVKSGTGLVCSRAKTFDGKIVAVQAFSLEFRRLLC